MKLLLALTVLPMVAFSAALSPLPASGYADCEVSTNLPVSVDFDRMNRLELALSLAPSPSNCVEVAVGADANHDGRLSVEEAAYTFGCDCGRWFLRDAAGAGRWGAVRSDTSWMADKASRETAYPQPWSVGWKEWRIPIGWGDYLGNVRGTISPNPTTELFTIDSNGTATIRKFGHEIKRTVDNRVWLDETLQNE